MRAHEPDAGPEDHADPRVREDQRHPHGQDPEQDEIAERHGQALVVIGGMFRVADRGVWAASHCSSIIRIHTISP